MPLHKDYTGLKYGKLTFVERIPNNSRRTSWKLLCDCGREIIVQASNVIGGGTRSCGCSRMGRSKTFITSVLYNYKKHASTRGLAFKLTRDEFIELIHSPCFYCGEVDSNNWINKRTGEQYPYNGIDRIDNSIGYEEGNVVPCCSMCNWSKRDMPGEDFIKWAKRLAAYQEDKQAVVLVDSLFKATK